MANSFGLSDAEDNISGLLNRGGIADLPLLRTFGKSPKSQVSGNWWTLVLLAYASLVTSGTLLQRLLPYLNFILDSEDLFCWYKRKKSFL